MMKLSEAEKIIEGYQRECNEVEQRLGKALGYPPYPNEKSDYVCIADHAPGTIAAEAAEKIARLEEKNALLRKLVKGAYLEGYEDGYNDRNENWPPDDDESWLASDVFDRLMEVGK